MTVASEALLPDLCRELELVVIARQDDFSFTALTPPPAWLHTVTDAAANGGPITLARLFPFLDNFLSEAEIFWHQRTAHQLASGPFAVDAPSGPLLLRATALNQGPHSLLVLERLRGDADPQRVLQVARENKLSYEKALGTIEAARSQIGTLVKLVDRLQQTGLPAEQASIVDGLARTVARLQSMTSITQDAT